MGCMESVLHVDAAEDRRAPDDEAFDIGNGVRLQGVVAKASEDPDALHDGAPGLRDSDFHAAEDSVDLQHRRLAHHSGLAAVQLDAAEHGYDLSALKVLGLHRPVATAEDGIELHVAVVAW